MSAAETMTLGVIVERRSVDSPWIDHTWKAVAVLPGGGAVAPGTAVDRGKGWERFFAGDLPLGLFRRETEGYRRNLSNETPVVYVVLDPTEAGELLDVRPFVVTACPYEAAGYEQEDRQVDGVPMPTEVFVFVRGFIERHHVDEPFVKRRQKHKTDGSLGAQVDDPPPETQS